MLEAASRAISPSPIHGVSAPRARELPGRIEVAVGVVRGGRGAVPPRQEGVRAEAARMVRAMTSGAWVVGDSGACANEECGELAVEEEVAPGYPLPRVDSRRVHVDIDYGCRYAAG